MATMRHVVGGGVQRDVDVGEQTAPGVGHGDPLAVDLADELVVGVAGDDQVDRVVESTVMSATGPVRPPSQSFWPPR